MNHTFPTFYQGYGGRYFCFQCGEKRPQDEMEFLRSWQSKLFKMITEVVTGRKTTTQCRKFYLANVSMSQSINFCKKHSPQSAKDFMKWLEMKHSEAHDDIPDHIVEKTIRLAYKIEKAKKLIPKLFRYNVMQYMASYWHFFKDTAEKRKKKKGHKDKKEEENPENLEKAIAIAYELGEKDADGAGTSDQIGREASPAEDSEGELPEYEEEEVEGMEEEFIIETEEYEGEETEEVEDDEYQKFEQHFAKIRAKYPTVPVSKVINATSTTQWLPQRKRKNPEIRRQIRKCHICSEITDTKEVSSKNFCMFASYVAAVTGVAPYAQAQETFESRNRMRVCHDDLKDAAHHIMEMLNCATHFEIYNADQEKLATLKENMQRFSTNIDYKPLVKNLVAFCRKYERAQEIQKQINNQRKAMKRSRLDREGNADESISDDDKKEEEDGYEELAELIEHEELEELQGLEGQKDDDEEEEEYEYMERDEQFDEDMELQEDIVNQSAQPDMVMELFQPMTVPAALEPQEEMGLQQELAMMQNYQPYSVMEPQPFVDYHDVQGFQDYAEPQPLMEFHHVAQPYIQPKPEPVEELEPWFALGIDQVIEPIPETPVPQDEPEAVVFEPETDSLSQAIVQEPAFEQYEAAPELQEMQPMVLHNQEHVPEQAVYDMEQIVQQHEQHQHQDVPIHYEEAAQMMEPQFNLSTGITDEPPVFQREAMVEEQPANELMDESVTGPASQSGKPKRNRYRRVCKICKKTAVTKEIHSSSNRLLALFTAAKSDDFPLTYNEALAVFHKNSRLVCCREDVEQIAGILMNTLGATDLLSITNADENQLMALEAEVVQFAQGFELPLDFAKMMFAFCKLYWNGTSNEDAASLALASVPAHYVANIPAAALADNFAEVSADVHVDAFAPADPHVHADNNVLGPSNL